MPSIQNSVSISSKAQMALALSLVLSACAPQDVADQMGRQAAESVVRPVIDDQLIGTEVDRATACLLSNAPAADIRALLRDFGGVAGTTTRAQIAAMSRTPATAACLAAAGVQLSL